jgi:hypothetical protein
MVLVAFWFLIPSSHSAIADLQAAPLRIEAAVLEVRRLPSAGLRHLVELLA